MVYYYLRNMIMRICLRWKDDMSKRRKKGKYTYIPILAAFVVLFVVFALTLATMTNRPVSTLAVDERGAYDGASDSSYDFVETEGKNGVTYYVISKETTQFTTVSTTAATEEQTVTTTTTALPRLSFNDMTTETTSAPLIVTTAATATQRNNGEKIAYLTFDDGPSINTEKLLDILDEYDVKATFFVIYHKNMEKKYKAIAERGHTIALHSYSHNYSKIYKTEKGYYQDLNKIHDYVEKVTGVDSKIIRFPGGSSNTVSRKYNKTIMKTLKKSVTEKGYVFHDWNIDSSDASGINRDPDLLVSRVEAGLKKKKTVVDILMHDTGKSKMTTVEALPRIIEAVQAAGYTIEPLTIDSTPIQHNW